jgi:hypothetical protein
VTRQFSEETTLFEMQSNFDAMMIAVRVLTALNEKRPPDPDDLDYLRRLAPVSAHLPPDEMACEVIKQAVRRRTEARAAGGGGSAASE